MSSILKMRNRHFFVLDVLALLSIPALALTLRLDQLHWWTRFGQALIFFTVVALVLKVPIFYRLGLYRRYWCFASINDLMPALIKVSIFCLSSGFYSSTVGRPPPGKRTRSRGRSARPLSNSRRPRRIVSGCSPVISTIRLTPPRLWAKPYKKASPNIKESERRYYE